MSDILSQSEIDELLSAFDAGASAALRKKTKDTTNARTYDFKTANKFPKEQIRTLNVVFQTFSQLFSTRLSSILRIACECEVLSIEECSFNEFNNTLPSPVVLAVCNAPPMYGSQIIEMSSEAAYMLISRLFGGGTSGESSKQFSEIDLALIERVLRQVFNVFDEAWAKILKVSMQLERLETSPQFAQIAPLNEPVAVVGLSLRAGDETGLMSICIPHAAVEPVVNQLNTRMLFSGSGYQEGVHDDVHTAHISQKLIHAPVSMVALFDQTPATVADIVNLQIGDVIRLNHSLDQPVTVKVQHIPKFRANVGTMGSKYALQIVDIIKEEKQDESFTR